MQKIVEIKNHQAVTDSVMVAKKFGKENSKVVRDIEKLIATGSAKIGDTPMFSKSTYVHPQNKQTYKKYYMTKDGFTLLAFGFTGRKANQFKIEYIKAFNLMNESLKNQTVSVIETPEDKLALTMTVANRTVKRVATIEKDIDELKNNVVIDSGSYAAIGRLVSRRVYEFLDERRYQHNRVNVSALFSDINHGIKQVTG